jgi:hypothetical protein
MLSLASADIFMSLSDNIQETFGLTPLEGMAAGLPVIVSDWDGYRSTVRNNLDGYTIKTYSLPSGYGKDLAFDYMIGNTTYDRYIGNAVQKVAVDVRECIDKLEILIKDRSKREEMGKNGKKRAINTFSWGKILKEYENLYQELNNIRLTEYKNYREFCIPRLPSDKPDPFHIFDDYPTEILSNELNFQLSDKSRSLSIDDLLILDSVSYSKSFIPDIDKFKIVLSSIKDYKIYNINDLATVTKFSESDIYLIVIFLLKYGFITTIGFDNG